MWSESNHYEYQRVLFKIAVLVYQCLNGLAPSYLADDWQLVSDYYYYYYYY